MVRIDIPPARSPYARPYAFVEFEDIQDAYTAVSELDQQPFALDPQFTLLVQMARSEPHPSRLAGAPNPIRDTPQQYDYPENHRAPRANFRRYDDYPPRRGYREDMPRGRGAYGSRNHNDYRGSDLDVRRRDLSPARVHSESGPAPYQHVAVATSSESANEDNMTGIENSQSIDTLENNSRDNENDSNAVPNSATGAENAIATHDSSSDPASQPQATTIAPGEAETTDSREAPAITAQNPDNSALSAADSGVAIDPHSSRIEEDRTTASQITSGDPTTESYSNGTIASEKPQDGSV